LPGSATARRGRNDKDQGKKPHTGDDAAMFALFLVIAAVWLWLVLVAAPVAIGLGQWKEKQARLEMMRQHPEHAAEIQKSMDMQEAQHRETMDRYSDGIRTTFSRPRKKTSKAGALAFRIGLGIARRLIK
jgi:hypothetical protein